MNISDDLLASFERFLQPGHVHIIYGNGLDSEDWIEYLLRGHQYHRVRVLTSHERAIDVLSPYLTPDNIRVFLTLDQLINEISQRDIDLFFIIHPESLLQYTSREQLVERRTQWHRFMEAISNQIRRGNSTCAMTIRGYQTPDNDVFPTGGFVDDPFVKYFPVSPTMN